MTLVRRLLAALVLALYVGGMLGLSFHLATEEHSSAPSHSRTCTSELSWRPVCPCRQSHLPHAAGDHDANLTTDEPGTGSVQDALDLVPAAAILAEPIQAPGPFEARPATSRVPILREAHPPEWGSQSPSDQPRAPPAA